LLYFQYTDAVSLVAVYIQPIKSGNILWVPSSGKQNAILFPCTKCTCTKTFRIYACNFYT